MLLPSVFIFLYVFLLGAIAVGVNAFGPGTGPVFLDNLLCRGDEISLGECFSSEVGQHNCDHAEDAGVICRDPDLQCQDGSVRLVDGVDGSPNEGRVEICMGDHWGTVCDDSWSNEDAAVVCNQMGYPGEGSEIERRGTSNNYLGSSFLN